MPSNLSLTRGPGGNQHPIAVRQFILDRLARVGDYFSGLHKAYCDELDRLSKERRREYGYHHPNYFSFYKKVREMIREGAIEFSGRKEVCDNPRFAKWENPPTKNFVRLARR